MRESSDLTNKILLGIGRFGHNVRLWRRNVGTFYGFHQVRALIPFLSSEGKVALRNMRPVKCGIDGEPDLDGWVVRSGVAVRAGVEIKAGKDRMSAVQENFKAQLERAGGIYITARDSDQCLEDLAKKLEKE